MVINFSFSSENKFKISKKSYFEKYATLEFVSLLTINLKIIINYRNILNMCVY